MEPNLVTQNVTWPKMPLSHFHFLTLEEKEAHYTYITCEIEEELNDREEVERKYLATCDKVQRGHTRSRYSSKSSRSLPRPRDKKSKTRLRAAKAHALQQAVWRKANNMRQGRRPRQRIKYQANLM